MDVTTARYGPASKSLIDWLKGIFGNQFSVSRGFSGFHDGIDLPAKEGTAIRALKSGIVSYARDARTQSDKGSSGWALGGGKVVNINVEGKLHTQYAHLKDISVKEGQFVKAGQIIGTVGRTGGLIPGTTTPGGPGSQFMGAHLHFGLWDKSTNKMVNPQKFLEALGDTATDASAQLAILTQLGIPTDLNYKFSNSDAIKIANYLNTGTGSQSLLPVSPKDAIASFGGMSVKDFLAAGGFVVEDRGFMGLEGALEDVGTQLNDTFTWLGFILVGIVLIAGGIFLLKPTKD